VLAGAGILIGSTADGAAGVALAMLLREVRLLSFLKEVSAI
jgi:hypothetical protein